MQRVERRRSERRVAAVPAAVEGRASQRLPALDTSPDRRQQAPPAAAHRSSGSSPVLAAQAWLMKALGSNPASAKALRSAIARPIARPLPPGAGREPASNYSPLCTPRGLQLVQAARISRSQARNAHMKASSMGAAAAAAGRRVRASF